MLTPINEAESPQTYDLRSWNEFRPLIVEIQQQYGLSTYELSGGASFNPLLFRGEAEADSDSALQTTLERASAKPFNVPQYLEVVDSCVNELESFTQRRWQTKSLPEMKEEIKRVQDSMRLHIPDSIYSYFVHL